MGGEVCGGKDLWKRCVFSLEWSNDGDVFICSYAIYVVFIIIIRAVQSK